MAVRYCSEKENNIVTAFLGLVDINSATCIDLFAAMKECLVTSGLKLQDCVGYASDVAANMVGKYNSLWWRIVEEAPNCLQMKCLCHSLALCVKHAFELMPSNLGFLLKRIPNWFTKSTILRDAYKKLFDIINAGTESSNLPKPFQKYNETCWLVRRKIIFNMLMNWNKLKAYF